MRKNMAYEECTVVGRNAVMEAYRSGKTIDKLFILDGCQDGPIKSILREARKRDTLIKFVSKEKLDSLSFHEKHQGVVAIAAAYEYATVEDLFKKQKDTFLVPVAFVFIVYLLILSWAYYFAFLLPALLFL